MLNTVGGEGPIDLISEMELTLTIFIVKIHTKLTLGKILEINTGDKKRLIYLRKNDGKKTGELCHSKNILFQSFKNKF